jgi:hypothetical protein
MTLRFTTEAIAKTANAPENIGVLIVAIERIEKNIKFMVCPLS